MELTPSWVANATGGRVVGDPGTAAVGTGLAFDTRRLVPGEVFVALAGERDGHDFVTAARRAGAAFVIVGRPVDDGPSVVVPDVAAALAPLARAGRERLDARVIAITGSVGKTSTKDLAASAVGMSLATHAAPESFNNEVGVPVTVLGAPSATEVLIVEMGARFPGNIAQLCAVTAPEIGIITNIGLSHAEHLGGPEGVARTKGELLEALPAHGLAVISADCVASAAQRSRTAAPVLTVGTGSGADLVIRDLELDAELRSTMVMDTPWGVAPVRLSLRGRHQALNAAQAAAVALHLGVPLERVAAGLERAQGAAWRMDLHGTPAGVRVINDAYNASPASVRAGLDALGALAVTGRRIAVLGEMRELGDRTAAEHAAIGTHAVRAGADLVIAVGAGTEALAAAATAAGAAVESVADADAATAYLMEHAVRGDVVLVKGSRAVGLEAVARALAEVAA